MLEKDRPCLSLGEGDPDQRVYPTDLGTEGHWLGTLDSTGASVGLLHDVHASAGLSPQSRKLLLASMSMPHQRRQLNAVFCVQIESRCSLLRLSWKGASRALPSASEILPSVGSDSVKFIFEGCGLIVSLLTRCDSQALQDG